MALDYVKVKALLLGAAERPRSEVTSYLEQTCEGDEGLVREVESLVRLLDEHTLALDPDASTRIIGPRRGQADQTTGDGRPPHQTEAFRARYQRLGALGRGGFGEVSAYLDRALQRPVALKSSLRPDGDAEGLLTAESRLLAYLDHPGVVQVYDGLQPGGAGYTMQVLRGGSLKQRLAQYQADGQKMPISEALRVATRVFEAVANAHARGVAHLDLKPANIMLEDYGRVVVIDWGSARLFDPSERDAYLERLGEATLPEPEPGGQLSGTPAYMPPEQFGTHSPVDFSADIYALGGTLYEMLTGTPPYTGAKTIARLYLDKTQTRPEPVRSLRPDVSERLEAICHRMLEPERDHRPDSLDDVLTELSDLSNFGQNAPSRHLRSGERLFSAGDEGHRVYQILEGEFEISVPDHDGHRVIATRSVGDIVGELAVISARPRSATVTATTQSVVRALDWQSIEAELAKVNPLLSRLVHSLSDKLIEATETPRRELSRES